MTTSVQEGFIDLDELLADSVSLAEDTKALKKGKEKLAGAWLSSPEKAQLQKEVAAIEQRREWESVSRTRLFQAQRCTFCGSVHTHYAGTFLHQTHIKLHSERWIRIEDAIAAKKLLLAEKIDESLVDVCINCHTTQEEGVV